MVRNKWLFQFDILPVEFLTASVRVLCWDNFQWISILVGTTLVPRSTFDIKTNALFNYSEFTISNTFIFPMNFNTVWNHAGATLHFRFKNPCVFNNSEFTISHTSIFRRNFDTAGEPDRCQVGVGFEHINIF